MTFWALPSRFPSVRSRFPSCLAFVSIPIFLIRLPFDAFLSANWDSIRAGRRDRFHLVYCVAIILLSARACLSPYLPGSDDVQSRASVASISISSNHAIEVSPISEPSSEYGRVRPLAYSFAVLGIEKAVMAYPPGFVQSYLDRVGVVGSVMISGILVEGSHRASGRSFVLASDHLISESDSDLVSEAFHRQFAGLVLSHDEFPVSEWARYDPVEVPVPSDYHSLRRLADRVHPRDLYQSGFLTVFGMTGAANDAKDYSAMAFSDPGRLASLSAIHPYVNRKARSIIRYWIRADPRFATLFANGPLARMAIAP